MSGFSNAFQVFQALSETDDKATAQRLLLDVLDSSGKVRFKSITDFHNHLLAVYQFSLRKKDQIGVLPGTWHLFYLRGCILLRVKTGGTTMRRNPHMTISAATGLEWEDEVMKLTRQGSFVPKTGAVPQASRSGNFRALQRLGATTSEILDIDDRWANACHFDFVDGFDATGADALPAIPI
jgi:hypothetical protein